ncbi:MAG: glgA4 [Labilithrix sp.]|jgi:glycosyltransferase involved in cell wall biosynthesis|nr:glgA4 [Labilithrix sp.]
MLLDDGRPWRSLEIALVSTTALSTPPKKYGGTELIVAELAQGLVDLGHRPTVFATGDSQCAGALRAEIVRPVWPPDTLTEVRHSAFAWSEIARGSFDIVHVHHAVTLPFSRFVGVPTVASVHHDRDDLLVAHYASYPEIAYVAISKRQQELAPGIPFRGVVHHGVSIDRYPVGEGAGGYCAFLGRFAPEKAPHLAMDAARGAGRPIRLGGEAHLKDQGYFERALRPRLGAPGVEWIGEVGGEAKLALLCDAACLLFPIQWEEPFGIVMIEAMLVGTPVIAFSRGSVPEVIEEGVTGHVVHTLDEMIERIRTISSFDRRRCRARARERWSSLRMAREHAALYASVIADHGLQAARGGDHPGAEHDRRNARTRG